MTMKVAASPGQIQKCSEPRYVIAVSDRAVKGTLILYHYSIQFWFAACDVPLNATTATPAFQKQFQASKLASIELLREPGWDANLRDGDKVKNKSVAVSVIHYSDTGDNVMPIYKDPDKAAAQKVWDKVVAAAKSYPYGEQEGFGRTFKHWANSIYYIGDDVNNSNTFVRWLVARAGLSMSEMSGFHPGRMAPQPITDLYGTPVPSGQEPPAPPGGK